MAQERKYRSEYEIEKQKKVYKQIKLERELAKELDEQLKKDNKTFAELVREAIYKYVCYNIFKLEIKR